MLEGLLAAILLLFAPAPAEPVPLVSLETIGGMPSPDSILAKGLPPMMIEVDAHGRLIVNDMGSAARVPVELSELGAVIRSRAECDATGCERIYIRADVDAPYSRVLSVISTLRHNGIVRIGLIDERTR